MTIDVVYIYNIFDTNHFHQDVINGIALNTAFSRVTSHLTSELAQLLWMAMNIAYPLLNTGVVFH